MTCCYWTGRRKGLQQQFCCSPRTGRSAPDLSIKEVPNQGEGLIGLVLQQEMSGVEEVKLDLLQVPLIGMRAIRREDLVVLAPHNQRRRLMRAEIRLDGGIQRQVGAVVVEHIQLNLVIS